MPKLPARIVAPFVLILLITGCVAGGYYQIQRQRSSELVMHALMTNNLANLQIALQQGGDPNATDRFGDGAPGGIWNQVKQLLLPHAAAGWLPAITCAVETEQVGAVRLLLAHGANPNARDNNGATPIMNIGTNWQDMVSFQQLDDPKYKPSAMDLALDRRESADYQAILALLRSKGGDVNAVTPEGETALMQASSQHNLGFVTLLLQNGADVNRTDKDGSTALIKAVETVMTPEDLAVVKRLLTHGANPNATTAAGFTPMQRAMVQQEFPVAVLLLQYGANPNLPKPDATFLQNAVAAGDFPAVQSLLQHGANPNLADENGSTPLLAAASDHKTALVRLLLAHGANPNQTDVVGDSPLIEDAAAELEDDYRRHHNGVVDDPQYESWAMDWPAGRPVPTATAALLLAHGANPNTANEDGKTAMYFAKASGKAALVTLLRAHGAKR